MDTQDAQDRVRLLTHLYYLMRTAEAASRLSMENDQPHGHSISRIDAITCHPSPIFLLFSPPVLGSEASCLRAASRTLKASKNNLVGI